MIPYVLKGAPRSRKCLGLFQTSLQVIWSRFPLQCCRIVAGKPAVIEGMRARLWIGRSVFESLAMKLCSWNTSALCSITTTHSISFWLSWLHFWTLSLILEFFHFCFTFQSKLLSNYFSILMKNYAYRLGHRKIPSFIFIAKCDGKVDSFYRF